MKIPVISCSLNPRSRSRALARQAHLALEQRGVESVWCDLREYPLPLCDGASWDVPRLADLKALIESADALLVAGPIYNFDLNAAAKNLLEWTGRAWTNKPVGFLCSAGGQGSYMAPIAFANSLMLDFRCLIIPRFVYATKQDFELEGDDPAVESEAITERIEQLVEAAIRLAELPPEG